MCVPDLEVDLPSFTKNEAREADSCNVEEVVYYTHTRNHTIRSANSPLKVKSP